MKEGKSSPRYKRGATTAVPTSLSDALFTTTQQRLLGFLFGQPERRFRATELIQLTGSGSGAVQRELQRLLESGLITAIPVDGRKYMQANRSGPLFEELHSITIKTFGLTVPLREALAPLAHRIAFAIVYGSVAKGSDSAASDIDLLIVADDLPLEKLYGALESVEQKLGRKINPTLYTAVEFKQRRRSGHPFLTRVLSGKYITLLGNENEHSTTR